MRRRGLEESRAGTLLALSTLSPALASVSHDVSHAARAAPPWQQQQQQQQHNPRPSVDQSASTSPAGSGGGALSISWLRDSILRPEASALPPDPHTARMLRPDTQTSQSRMLRPDGSILEASVGVNQEDGRGGGREPLLLVPEPTTPTTAPARWGGGANAGDIARRESRREHVRGAARPWVDPSLP
jgi:hypothetical protein